MLKVIQSVMNKFSERVDGQTPSGGQYSIAYWQDANGEPTLKENAVRAEIVEYLEGGKEVARSYMKIN